MRVDDVAGDICSSLGGGHSAVGFHAGCAVGAAAAGRGLHSSTFQLNVSNFCPMCWGALTVSDKIGSS
jgi:hypothetical protein